MLPTGGNRAQPELRPTNREFEKLGYDIESCIPGTGRLRFIEVKGAELPARAETPR